MSSFAQRAIVTFTLGPLAIFVIYYGRWLYAILIGLILALAAAEFSRIGRKLGWSTASWILVPAVIPFFAAGWWRGLNLLAPVTLITLLIVLAYALWLYEIKKDAAAPATWMAMTAGLILIGWIGSHFFSLRNLASSAWQWTMLAMLSTWIADSGAYLVGRFLAGRVIGKHHLSPRLSPNKTVEGYIGGIVLGTSFTIGIAYFLELPLVGALILGLLVSIVSPMGDLGISLLKREAGVKDSGTLFPGHGGALDRVDSLMWSMAMAYYLVLFIERFGI
jgi:phosphatidate cytidylyltransferase